MKKSKPQAQVPLMDVTDKAFAKAWFEMGRSNPNEFERLWESIQFLRNRKEDAA